MFASAIPHALKLLKTPAVVGVVNASVNALVFCSIVIVFLMMEQLLFKQLIFEWIF